MLRRRACGCPGARRGTGGSLDGAIRHISDEQGVAQGGSTQITLTPQSKETKDETAGQTQNVDPGSARTYQWSIGPDVTGVTVLSMTDANGTQTYVPSP